jgi:molecular chaperone IbpA
MRVKLPPAHRFTDPADGGKRGLDAHARFTNAKVCRMPHDGSGGARGRLPFVPIAQTKDVAMNLIIDFAPLWRSTVGFDGMLDLLDDVAKMEPTEGYPPYNIGRTGEEAYKISLAVAGFTADQLSVSTKPNLLIVSGTQPGGPEAERLLYRGISSGSFERRFWLADHVKANEVELRDGLLTIELERDLPEAKRPRRIQIGNGGATPSSTARPPDPLHGPRCIAVENSNQTVGKALGARCVTSLAGTYG